MKPLSKIMYQCFVKYPNEEDMDVELCLSIDTLMANRAIFASPKDRLLYEEVYNEIHS